MKTFAPLAAATLTLAAFAATPASAQSTEEVLGAVIGGTAGAIIGGEIDNGRRGNEGEVIGALVGGTLGYAIGERIDDRNDRRRYEDAYYRRDTGYRTAYPVYRDTRYPQSAYYPRASYPAATYSYGYAQPRSRSHPVFVTHPGRGHGVHKAKRRW